MKQHTYITDEQLWTDVEAVFAANRPARNEAEWEALTREVSDGELEAAKATAVEGVERKSVRHKRAWWSAIAAAAVFVIVAGLGVVFYQMKAPSDLTANVSPTDGTHESNQWDTPVPPVGHADSTSRISPHDQSPQPTQLVASAHTSSHIKPRVQSHQEEPSDSFEDIDIEEIQEVVYIIEDVDQELEAQRQTMDALRARGQRLAAMVQQNLQNDN